MTTVQRGLRAVFARMRVQKAALWGSFGLAGGTVIALLLHLASFFWPLEHTFPYSAGAILGCGVLGVLMALAWPISPKQAAKHADACGLEARIQTALELQSAPQTPMTDLQKSDALTALRNMRVKETMPLRPHRPSLVIALTCAALMVGAQFIQNPQNEILRAKAGFRQEMQKQAKLLEEGAAKLDTAEDSTAQETRKLLGDLARELRTSDEPRQALQAIDQVGREMTKLRQNEQAAMRKALSQSGLDALSNAMEQQDKETMRAALENEDKDALAAAFSQAAENMGESPEAEALKAAANAISAGNPQKALAALNAAATANTGFAAQGSALLQMAQMGATRASQSLAASTQGNAGKVMAALGALGQGQSGSGSGQGAGSGGSGQGAGNGAGKGTTNLDAGYTNSQRAASQGGGAPPQEKLAEYEAIYDPTRLGGDSEVAQERGSIGEGDTSELTISGGAGNINESVPYPDVALEYQEAAIQSVQTADLPAYVQKWVKNYFQSLLE